MSISVILLGYHIGLPITHAGNVMQRISFQGTKRSVWKSRSLRSTPAWLTHGVTMLCSNPLAPAAAWAGVILSTFCSAKAFTHTFDWQHFALLLLLNYEGPGVGTAKKPWERLAVLFSQIQVHYTQQRCKNRLTNLRLSMITGPNKPWSKHAVLDCKGGEARHLLPALTVLTPQRGAR